MNGLAYPFAAKAYESSPGLTDTLDSSQAYCPHMYEVIKPSNSLSHDRLYTALSCAMCTVAVLFSSTFDSYEINIRSMQWN